MLTSTRGPPGRARPARHRQHLDSKTVREHRRFGELLLLRLQARIDLESRILGQSHRRQLLPQQRAPHSDPATIGERRQTGRRDRTASAPPPHDRRSRARPDTKRGRRRACRRMWRDRESSCRFRRRATIHRRTARHRTSPSAGIAAEFDQTAARAAAPSPGSCACRALPCRPRRTCDRAADRNRRRRTSRRSGRQRQRAAGGRRALSARRRRVRHPGSSTCVAATASGPRESAPGSATDLPAALNASRLSSPTSDGAVLRRCRSGSSRG